MTGTAHAVIRSALHAELLWLAGLPSGELDPFGEFAVRNVKRLNRALRERKDC